MPRSIELVLQDGETLESALRRFERKDVQEEIIKEVKKHSLYLKPGEKRRIKPYSMQVRTRKHGLLEFAIQEVKALSPKRQDAIAEAILADLRQEADPSATRFQDLVEAKYTRGLSPAESLEFDGIEAAFRDSDEAFYRPIIERAKAKKPSAGKRRGS